MTARLRTAAALILPLALAAATAIAFELRGRLPFSSDQAIVSLIGLDILGQGKHPVFCYGSEYAGTLEPHLLAATLGTFGATIRTFRLTMLALTLALIAVVAATTRKAFGERAGLATALYLAVPPSYFLLKTLTSDGAYTSLLLLSATAVALALRIDRRSEDGASVSREALGLGFVLGLAWWVHPLSIFLGPPLALLALTGRRRTWLAPSTLGLGLTGFLVGDLPWWWHNLKTGWASLAAPELEAARAGSAGDRITSLFEQGITALLGGRSVWSSGSTFEGSTIASWALLALIAVAGLHALLRAESRQRRRAALLFLAVFATVPALNLLVQRTDFREPRYLLPAYLAIAPLFGLAVDGLGRRSRAAAAALVAAVLALGVASQWRAPALRGIEGGFFRNDIHRLVGWLEARGVTALYAPYWTAYRLTFVSQGRIVASPFGTGTNGFVRHPELRAVVDAAPAPDFLLAGEDRRRFEVFLARRGLASTREETVGYTLYRGVDPVTVDLVSSCLCIPSEPRPGDIEWLGARGPNRLSAGSEARYTTRLRSRLRWPLSGNVHLSYHWRHPGGEVVVAEGLRSKVSTLAMRGQIGESEMTVRADVPPGRYELVIDLVDENVAWFENLGTPPLVLQVAVEAAPGDAAPRTR